MHCNDFRQNPEKLSRLVQNKKIENRERNGRRLDRERGAETGELNKGNSDLDPVFPNPVLSA